MLQLPSFQAQRPEAVQANVINQPAAPRASFWGTVAPSLLQGASQIRTMIEGNPEVEYQNNQLQAKEAESWLNRIDATDNPEERKNLAAQAAAYYKSTGNEKGLAALQGFDPTKMDSKKQMDRNIYDTFQNGREGLQARGAAGIPAQEPGQAAPSGFEEAKAGVGAEKGIASPEGPKTTGVGSDFMPPDVPVDVGSEGAPHPMLQQASQALKVNGYGEVPPHQLALTPDGLAVSFDAIAHGNFPFDASKTLLMPAPGPDGMELAAAAQSGQVKAPKLRELVSNMGALRTMTAIRAGRDPSPEDIFAMGVDDHQAEQLWREEGYKSGADQKVLDLQDLRRLALLAQDSGRAPSLLAADDPTLGGSGGFKASQDKWNFQATRAERAEAQPIVDALVKDQAGADLLQYRVKSDAEKAKILRAQVAEKLQQDAAANQYHQMQLGVQMRGQDLNHQDKLNSLGVQQAKTLAEGPLKDQQLANAQIKGAADYQKVKEKDQADYIKSLGLPESADAEVKRSKELSTSASQALKEERINLNRWETQLRGYNFGKAPQTLTFPGQAAPIASTEISRADAVKRLQQAVKDSTKRIGDLQTAADNASSSYNTSAKLATNAVPSPSTYLRQYMDRVMGSSPSESLVRGEQVGPVAPGGQPAITKHPQPVVVHSLTNMYKNINIPVPGKGGSVPTPFFQHFHNLEELKAEWGPRWGMLNRVEQAIIGEAFGRYQKEYVPQGNK